MWNLEESSNEEDSRMISKKVSDLRGRVDE